MTPEEKAEALFEKFYSEIEDFDLEHEDTLISERKGYAKKCALICVNEILEADPSNPAPDGYYELLSDRKDEVREYWQSVKTEIEKL